MLRKVFASYTDPVLVIMFELLTRLDLASIRKRPELNIGRKSKL